MGELKDYLHFHFGEDAQENRNEYVLNVGGIETTRSFYKRLNDYLMENKQIIESDASDSTELRKENLELKRRLKAEKGLFKIQSDLFESKNKEIASWEKEYAAIRLDNFRQEKEIERLKGLMRATHEKAYSNGYTCGQVGNSYYEEDCWQTFKTENNL